MVRPKNKYPAPTLRLKDGAWRIRWRWEDTRYEFSTGYRETDNELADVRLLEASLALREAAPWPEWADGVAAIDNWLSRLELKDNAQSISGDELIQLWLENYKASASPERVRLRKAQLNRLNSTYDLSSITPEQAGKYIQSLICTPQAKYLSHDIVKILDSSAMTPEDIASKLLQVGVKNTLQTIKQALKNRRLFERIPLPGKKYKGVYRAVCDESAGLAPRTRNDHLMTIKMFYRWATESGYLPNNPFSQIKKAKTSDHAEIIWLSRDERDAIVGSQLARERSQYGLLFTLAYVLAKLQIWHGMRSISISDGYM